VANFVILLTGIDLLDLLVFLDEDAHSHLVILVIIVRDTLLGEMIGKFSFVDFFFVIDEEDFDNRRRDAKNAQSFSKGMCSHDGVLCDVF